MTTTSAAITLALMPPDSQDRMRTLSPNERVAFMLQQRSTSRIGRNQAQKMRQQIYTMQTNLQGDSRMRLQNEVEARKQATMKRQFNAKMFKTNVTAAAESNERMDSIGGVSVQSGSDIGSSTTGGDRHVQSLQQPTGHHKASSSMRNHRTLQRNGRDSRNNSLLINKPILSSYESVQQLQNYSQTSLSSTDGTKHTQSRHQQMQNENSFDNGIHNISLQKNIYIEEDQGLYKDQYQKMAQQQDIVENYPKSFSKQELMGRPLQKQNSNQNLTRSIEHLPDIFNNKPGIQKHKNLQNYQSADTLPNINQSNYRYNINQNPQKDRLPLFQKKKTVQNQKTVRFSNIGRSKLNDRFYKQQNPMIIESYRPTQIQRVHVQNLEKVQTLLDLMKYKRMGPASLIANPFIIQKDHLQDIHKQAAKVFVPDYYETDAKRAERKRLERIAEQFAMEEKMSGK